MGEKAERTARAVVEEITEAVYEQEGTFWVGGDHYAVVPEGLIYELDGLSRTEAGE